MRCTRTSWRSGAQDARTDADGSGTRIDRSLAVFFSFSRVLPRSQKAASRHYRCTSSTTTLLMTTIITTITVGDTTTTEDSNTIDKTRPRIVSFDPNIDWLKESKKILRRKKWKRQSKRRWQLAMEGEEERESKEKASRELEEKAYVAYKFLCGNRKYLLERYDEDWVFAATLHTCVDELLGLRPRPPSRESREEMEYTLQKLEANDRPFSRFRSMGIYFLAMIHAVFVKDGEIERKLEDEGEPASNVGYDIHRDKTQPFGDVSNNHTQHSTGSSQSPNENVSSQESRGAFSSSTSSSVSSPKLKRARLAPAKDAGDENSEIVKVPHKGKRGYVPSSVGHMDRHF
jgi:hypothetical protein